MAHVLIGTSGWHYNSWRGSFYPAGLPIKATASILRQPFETAELNGVFYRTPHRNREKLEEADRQELRLYVESV